MTPVSNPELLLRTKASKSKHIVTTATYSLTSSFAAAKDGGIHILRLKITGIELIPWYPVAAILTSRVLGLLISRVARLVIPPRPALAAGQLKVRRLSTRKVSGSPSPGA